MSGILVNINSIQIYYIKTNKVVFVFWSDFDFGQLCKLDTAFMFDSFILCDLHVFRIGFLFALIYLFLMTWSVFRWCFCDFFLILKF